MLLRDRLECSSFPKNVKCWREEGKLRDFMTCMICEHSSLYHCAAAGVNTHTHDGTNSVYGGVE